MDRPHRRTLYAVTAALWVSGAAWLVLQRPWGRGGEASGSPWAPALMALHGALAMGFLALLGSLIRHVISGWRSSRNRAAGLALLGTALALAASGWGLYYAGAESTRARVSLFHWGLGLALPVLMAAHIVLGRASRAARRRGGPPAGEGRAGGLGGQGD